MMTDERRALHTTTTVHLVDGTPDAPGFAVVKVSDGWHVVDECDRTRCGRELFHPEGCDYGKPLPDGFDLRASVTCAPCAAGFDPAACYGCGAVEPSFGAFDLVTIDADPGDPEVGPRPNLIDVPTCPTCAAAQR